MFSKVMRRVPNHIRNGKFKLPTLPYEIRRGVKPLMSQRQLDTHYNKIHQCYVDNANRLVKGTEFEKMDLETIIKRTCNEKKDIKKIKIHNTTSAHFNHTMLWSSLKPVNERTYSSLYLPHQRSYDSISHKMPPKLKTQIEHSFGSVDTFEKKFTTMADSLFGSGWTWLVADKKTSKLHLWKGYNERCPLVVPTLVPLLGIDCWEHAFIIDYNQRKRDYVRNFFKCVNWDTVARRMSSTRPSRHMRF